MNNREPRDIESERIDIAAIALFSAGAIASWVIWGIEHVPY